MTAPASADFRTLIDFDSEARGEWHAVNDGVMGGRSSGSLRLSGDGTGVFEGDLSLENDGGFASVRTEIPEGTLSGLSRLLLRVRGDGRRYQLRLRMSSTLGGIAYVSSFDTAPGAWRVVEAPAGAFEPSFRGERPGDAPPLRFPNVRQIGLMLVDGQEGPFRLEIDWIGADRGGEER